MINRTILSAVAVVSMSFAPFVLAQVLSVPSEAMQDELDVNAGEQNAGEQDDPRMMGGPQDHPAMMDERGGGHPGMMGGPQRGLMF